MWKKTLREYRRAKSSHADLYRHLIYVRDNLKDLTQEDLVDIALVLRSISALADDIRKECNGIKELVERVVCLRWVQATLNDPGAPDAIRGELATGTPDVRQMASLPRPNSDPEGYEKLMRSIGAITAARKDLVRPHWPGLTEWITRLAKKGKQLPKGIDPNKTYPLYRLFPLRRKKGIDIDEIEIEGTTDGQKES